MFAALLPIVATGMAIHGLTPPISPLAPPAEERTDPRTKASRTLPRDVRLEDVTVPGCLLDGPRPLVRATPSVADGRPAKVGHQPVDMRGTMGVPAFVDMHAHLDHRHVWPRAPDPDGTFQGALETVRADTPGRWDAEDLVARMDSPLRARSRHAGDPHPSRLVRRGRGRVLGRVRRDARGMGRASCRPPR